MNVGIWGKSPLREAVHHALEEAGHSVATVAAEAPDVSGLSALVLLPSDDLESATRHMFDVGCAAAAETATVERIVLVSTQSFFARLPRHWNLTPWWRPRPSPGLNELCPWLQELSLREVTRTCGLHTHVLRLGDDVSENEAAGAVVESLSRPLRGDRVNDWTIEHRGEPAGRSPANKRPWHVTLAPPEPIASRPIRRVTIFGAGGPLGAALAQELAPHYALRLTDARAIDTIIEENKPQKLGAPLPTRAGDLVPGPYGPHESRVVDVRDFGQVRDACADSDAIINCSVLRHDPIDAFRVNTLGAYHIAQAAVEHQIRRVVQTGPEQLTISGGRGDYLWDYEIASDPPSRPGQHRYGHSKFLGQEILRVFAEWHDLEVPTLLFSKFADAHVGSGFYPMIVTWQDAARALRAALEVPSLPSPYEEFHVTIPLPHGRFRTDKLARVLGWEARETLERLWQNASESEGKPK